MSSVDNVLDGEAFGAFARPHVEQLLAQRLDIERIAEVEELLKDKTDKSRPGSGLDFLSFEPRQVQAFELELCL